MELHLQRTYHQNGTNGFLTLEGDFLCYTIELPYRDNRRGLSCIPEGNYGLEIRYSPRFKNHLLVENVPGRTLILIHPANNALTELKGCIAPVTELTGIGKGTDSQPAFMRVKNLVYDAIHAGERARLIITKQHSFI